MSGTYSLRIAPVLTPGLLIAAGATVVTHPTVHTAPVPQTRQVQLTAAKGDFVGKLISVFVSNGTAEHPNAGLLIGDGYSFTPGVDDVQGASCY